VVITRLPGVVPFVQPSDLVHWADIADVDSLVGAILAALDNPGRAQQIDRAFNFIVQHSWSAVADRYLAVYRELVAQR
jgi:glycosyltransferase involved in cell wall biosynthesis